MVDADFYIGGKGGKHIKLENKEVITVNHFSCPGALFRLKESFFHTPYFSSQLLCTPWDLLNISRPLYKLLQAATSKIFQCRYGLYFCLFICFYEEVAA